MSVGLGFAFGLGWGFVVGFRFAADIVLENGVVVDVDGGFRVGSAGGIAGVDGERWGWVLICLILSLRV